MVGDWVICYHPSRPQSFERVSVGLLHTLDQQEHGHIKEDSPLFRIVQPIPFTSEILEKNGFERLNDVSNMYHCDIYNYDRIYFDNDKAGMYSNNEWLVRIEADYASSGAFCELNYLHELQHLLKLCNLDFYWKV